MWAVYQKRYAYACLHCPVPILLIALNLQRIILFLYMHLVGSVVFMKLSNFFDKRLAFFRLFFETFNLVFAIYKMV